MLLVVRVEYAGVGAETPELNYSKAVLCNNCLKSDARSFWFLIKHSFFQISWVRKLLVGVQGFYQQIFTHVVAGDISRRFEGSKLSLAYGERHN